MAENIFPALIALVGVVLSALISQVTSKRVAGNEIQKIRFEAKRTYEAKLLEERLRRYPQVFSLLSAFIKEIQFGAVSRETIGTLFTEVNAWDSQNAIVLSHSSAEVLYIFRQDLNTMLQASGDDQLEVKLGAREFLEGLRSKTANVEFVLRSDIGIYGIRGSEESGYDVYVIDSLQKLEELRKRYKAAATGTPGP